jgi:DNA invertase Pin-like site-specific DNA recombinase
MATVIGYARVSTDDQDCTLQEAALRAAGCSIIRSEKRSSTTGYGWAELKAVLSSVRSGDTLMVTRIDRLARSVADLQQIVGALNEKGAFLRVIEQPIDTAARGAGAFVQMLDVFAHFETAIRNERRMDGVAKAKAAGVYRGRKPSVPVDEIRKLQAEGVAPREIAKRLKVGRSSVYRALEPAVADGEIEALLQRERLNRRGNREARNGPRMTATGATTDRQ